MVFRSKFPTLNALGNLSQLKFNLFFYGWKVSEIRQAVKQTIRQALRCP